MMAPSVVHVTPLTPPGSDDPGAPRIDFALVKTHSFCFALVKIEMTPGIYRPRNLSDAIDFALVKTHSFCDGEN